MMVQIKYAQSRLSALRMYLGDENTTVEQELVSCLDRLWEQKIPEAVRDFIERSEKGEGQPQDVRAEEARFRGGRERRRGCPRRRRKGNVRARCAARGPPCGGEEPTGERRRKGCGKSEEKPRFSPGSTGDLFSSGNKPCSHISPQQRTEDTGNSVVSQFCGA